MHLVQRISRSLFILLFVAAITLPAQPSGGVVRGVMTDESGAVIPAATVTLTGNGAQKEAQTQADGSYQFQGVAPGQYTVRASLPGFATFSKTVTVSGAANVLIPIPMTVSAEKQEITVKEESGPSVSVQPDDNATALVLRGEDLASLPDDPDDLADALQALAGPGAGPNGGSIYIDGFSGGNLPPKESIREIRVNQNPFSAEYDKLGFGRIEILTKPGTDNFRGTLFFNEGNGVFNSRNPFSTNKPDYSNRMIGANFGGPINKRASFFVDFNRRDITDNAIVNAVFLDPTTLLQSPIQQSVVTPNTRTTIAPRIDYQLSTNNTLVARFEEGFNSRDNQGIGGHTLPPPFAQDFYNSTGNNQNAMITETAILSPKTINETRFQFFRNYTNSIGNLLPTVNVSGAFTAGGANWGNNYDTQKHFELQNNTSISHGKNTIRFGVRLRRMSDQSVSPNGFGGQFFFDGGIAPILDANNQPVIDPATGQPQTTLIQGIEQYRRTLLFQQLGYSAGQIRQLGGGASQFIIDAGTPNSSIVQYDAGLFAQNDWRLRPNLTLSYGVRYEIQTNISDHSDFAPRIGFAWAPGSTGKGPQKTVIRGGFGFFYDRVSDSLIERARLLNGVNQLVYTVTNPDTFPLAPPSSSFSPAQNSIYTLDARLRPDYLMQSAIGIERQLPKNTTVSLTYTNTRALHLQQTVPINTPLPGTYIPNQPNSGVRPYGLLAGDLFEYESGGFMRQNILMATFNTRFSRYVSLFGNYSFNRTNDTPNTPSDPYNLALDYGRSSLERRHRFQLMGSVIAPMNIRLNPFITLQSGAPYDITVGQDLFGDTLKNARPAFASGPGQDIVATPLGFFYTAPVAGSTANLVPRNYLTGAGLVSINMRIGRTWGFGPARGAGNAMRGGGDMGGRDHGGPGGPSGGGGMRMGAGGPGGGRGGPGGELTEHRYNLTLSVMFNNILNHVNPGGYIGNLNSPQFGLPTTVNTGFGGGGFGGPGGGGGMANNRRLEMSMRFSF